MSTPTSTSIVKALQSRSLTTTGKKVAPQAMKSYLDAELRQAAQDLRELIISYAQRGHKTPFAAQGKGTFAEGTKVLLDSSGLKLDLPEFADELDKGRAPGSFPPLGAIILWVQKNRIMSRRSGNGKGRGQNIQQIAFAIANAIYKHGIVARPFLDEALETVETTLGQIIDTVVLPDIASILDEVFNEK